METVELITDGHAHIVVIDGEVKLRRNADGTWNSSEAGWSVQPSPLLLRLDANSPQSWEAWTIIRPDGTTLDHVFGLKEDGTGFICAITETRRMS
jgi:hypothetical protein